MGFENYSPTRKTPGLGRGLPTLLDEVRVLIESSNL